MQWSFKSVYFNNFKGSIIHLDVTYPTQPTMISYVKLALKEVIFSEETTYTTVRVCG